VPCLFLFWHICTHASKWCTFATTANLWGIITACWGEKEKSRLRKMLFDRLTLLRSHLTHIPLQTQQSICWWHLVLSVGEMRDGWRMLHYRTPYHSPGVYHMHTYTHLISEVPVQFTMEMKTLKWRSAWQGVWVLLNMAPQVRQRHKHSFTA